MPIKKRADTRNKPAPSGAGNRHIVRKSEPYRRRVIASSKGTTGSMQELLDLGSVQKGLFGLNDLSVFGAHKGSLTIDLVGTEDVPTLQVISPVFSFKQLTQLFLISTTLRECVKAYETNIEGYGHSIEYIGPEGKKSSAAARREKEQIDGLLSSLTGTESLEDARKNSRIDKEVIGARAFEVLRDASDRVIGINRIPTNTLLMTRLETDAITVEERNPITGRMDSYSRRFRRFVQKSPDGKSTYFKELGDPRVIDPNTGKENPSLSIEDEATEIYYDRYYTPGSPYGTPQWASCIPSMMGGREAELVNLSFFRDNGIPAMAVLVSGGALTEESFNKIEGYFSDERGKGSHNRIIVLEATPDISEASGVDGTIAAPRVDIKTMLSDRQHEGLFKQYIEGAGSKVRQTMRLPPIYVGSAEEYNRASAFASMQVAEQQIFVPERRSWDFFMNDVVLRGYNFRFWRVASAAPSFNDSEEVARILTVLSNEGALTPNVCIGLANRILSTEIETVQEDWGDMPFAATIIGLEGGKKIDGFAYVMEAMQAAVAPAVNAPDAEGDDREAQQANLRKGLARYIDELAEEGLRLAQYKLAA